MRRARAVFGKNEKIVLRRDERKSVLDVYKRQYLEDSFLVPCAEKLLPAPSVPPICERVNPCSPISSRDCVYAAS